MTVQETGAIYGIFNGTGTITGTNRFINRWRVTSPPFTANQTWIKPLGVGRVNSDLYIDLLTIAGDGAIYASCYNSNGTCLAESVVQLSNPWPTEFTSANYVPSGVLRKVVGIGDANYDGYDDIVTVDNWGNISAISYNNKSYVGITSQGRPWDDGSGTGVFNSLQDWYKPIGAADMNKDGYSDIILLEGTGYLVAGLTYYSPLIVITEDLENPWGADFTTRQDWNKPLGVKDVNGDGWPDILIVNGNGDISAGLVTSSPSLGIHEVRAMGNLNTQGRVSLHSQQTVHKVLNMGYGWDWWF